MQNQFAAGELELAGQPLDLKDVDQDVYIVAAINDHIVPWTSSYATIRHVSGDVRFVLSSGGHIAGIVNPPGPKAWYVTGAPTTSPTRTTGAAGADGSRLLVGGLGRVGRQRAGALVDPPRLGSEPHPVLGEAPGEYVRR